MCLQIYFDEWDKLLNTELFYNGLQELIVKEQFTNSRSRNLSVYLVVRNSNTLKERWGIAEQYLVAHNQTLMGSDQLLRNRGTREILRIAQRGEWCW